MASLITPTRGGIRGPRRPGGLYTLNVESPQTRGLLALYAAGTFGARELVGGVPAVPYVTTPPTFAGDVVLGPTAQPVSASSAAWNWAAPTALAGGVTALSLVMWIARSSTADTVILALTNDSGSGGPNIKRFGVQWWSDGNIYVVVENGALAYSQMALNVTGAHCGVIVYDASLALSANNAVKFYWDGVLQTLSAGSGSPPSSYANPVSMGFGRFLDGNAGLTTYSNAGRIAQAAVYNRALTATEVAQLSDANLRWDALRAPSRMVLWAQAVAAARANRLALLGVS